MPKSKRSDHYRSGVETELSAAEYEKFLALCEQRKMSKSALAREAIINYLNYIEETRVEQWEIEAAANIKCTTDRICAMLAKQGMHMGTLLELTKQNHQEFGGQQQFDAAVQYSSESLRKFLEKRLRHSNAAPPPDEQQDPLP